MSVKEFEHTDTNVRREISIGMFLFLLGGAVSFFLGIIPYLGPLLALAGGFGLGYGCGWIGGLWPRFLGSFGVLAGLFISSWVKFGLDWRTIVLFVFQAIFFFYGFYKGSRRDTKEREHEGAT